MASQRIVGRMLALVTLSFASPIFIQSASAQQSDYEQAMQENQARNKQAVLDFDKAAIERETAASERDKKAMLERDQQAVLERDQKVARDRQEKAAVADDQKAKLAHGPGSKWLYENTTDKMRGTSSRFASLKSKNALSLKFPYHPGFATLTMRNRPEDGLNVILSIEGQFICRSYAADTVSVKFDNRPIQSFPCLTSDDGSAGVLFIKDEKSALKAVSKLRRTS